MDTKICPIHPDITMTAKEGKFGTFYSHKDGEGWCNGKSKDYKETWDRRKSDFVDSLGTPKAPEKPDVDWDAKERRMVRMNVLNRTVELIVGGFIEMENLEASMDRLESLVYKEKNAKSD